MANSGLARGAAIRIAIFNHKGGVGKTTLTVNIAGALAGLGHQVLLVDSDPQCNLSSYLVEAAVFDDILDKSESPQGQTIWTAVKPIVDGTGDAVSVAPVERLAGVHLLYGDIRLSTFEEELTQFWNDCLSRKTRGFRGTTALSALISRTTETLPVEYVFYDCGPNIGPLNRCILLDCDYFIIPAALDEFSIRALKTLGFSLENWIKLWDTIAKLSPDNVYVFPGKPRFLGYIEQRFRIYGSQISSGQRAFIPRIERQMHADIVEVLHRIDPALAPYAVSDALLGEVQEFSSLASESQSQGVPMDQVRGGNVNLKATARDVFRGIAQKIVDRTKV